MKKIIFSLVALFGVVMVWAFVVPQSPVTSQAAQTTAWFVYTGDGTDYENPEDYELVQVVPDCPGNVNLCAINVIEEDQKPQEAALAAIQNDIMDALANGEGGFTNIRLRQ